ncbi:hypothetical protein [uncultured Akkermansia sp.]|uniref:hypothetical protein n=1 Tax=uncultured Akkermansia sp. TaxID=512294 RepID=UPI00265D065B|nr:hypothetical protein [uncultured Akkermansia sp.]
MASTGNRPFKNFLYKAFLKLNNFLSALIPAIFPVQKTPATVCGQPRFTLVPDQERLSYKKGMEGKQEHGPDRPYFSISLILPGKNPYYFSCRARTVHLSDHAGLHHHSNGESLSSAQAHPDGRAAPGNPE